MIQVNIRRMATRDIQVQVLNLKDDNTIEVINDFETNKIGSKLHWVMIEIMSLIVYAIEEYL